MIAIDMNRALPPPPSPPSCHPPAQAEDEEVPFPIAEETDSPEAKKHKLGDHANISDEEDGYTNPIFRTCTVYDSEEENYCPDIPGAKMDKPLWEKYWKQIKESEVSIISFKLLSFSFNLFNPMHNRSLIRALVSVN